MFLFRKTPKFPNDADGDALRRMWKQGKDLSKPHDVDFFVSIGSEEDGMKLQPLVEAQGFQCALECDDDSEKWTLYCTKRMLLEYQQLLDTQALLHKLSKPFGGYSDGWGTFGV